MFCFFLAEQLGMPIDEVLNMPSTEIYAWVAYFNVKREYEEKELERAKREAKMSMPRRRIR